ncbi:T9SS type B sorting domain-containing protein, partial [Neptunitalea chrysea]|uniref:T9SS type B sorting domain-containing protein n=1 Tax=Neptunitalea chrysea TaxID=1647581 RepID=UPI0024905BBD
PPIATTPNDINFCDNDNDGYGTFVLDAVPAEVIPNDGQSYTVTYHVTQTDAENGVNVFTSPYENIVQDQQTLYVRVENDATGCYDVVPLVLIVNPTPIVPIDLPDLELCDDNVADGYTEFDLSEQDATVYGAQSTSDYTIEYYLSETAAEEGLYPLPSNYYTNTSQYQQTVWVRLEDNITGCPTIRSFDLIVNPNPVINPNYDNDLALCDDFGEVNDELTVFDLTVENDEITAGVNGYVVTYYETEADAIAGTNAIADDTAYENTLGNPYTLFVRVEDLNTGCYSKTTVTIRVLNNPTPLTNNQSLENCDDDLDGDENNGQVEFDLTTYEADLLNGETDVTATYYETYTDAYDGTNAISNTTAYYNVTPDLQTIYVRVTNDNTGCYTVVDFNLIVIPLPDVTDETVYYLCETDNDDIESLPLTDMDSWVMDGADTSGVSIVYYPTEADAIADQNEYAGPNITVNGTESIAVRVEDTVTGCIQTIAFTIDIEQAPLAETPDVYAICESLDANGYYNNDGEEEFDLTISADIVIAGQDTAAFTVSFYETYDDAINQENAIPTDEWYPYVTGSTIVYAVVTNNDTGCTNGDPIEVVLEVEPLPEVTLDDAGGIVCTDATNNPVLGTDLGTDYTYTWNTGATTPTIEVTEAGEYYVTIVDSKSYNQCSYQTNHVYIEEASLPSETPTVIQSEVFNGDNNVEVIAEGAGVSNYGYQLDGGTMQNSGLFTNVAPGVHTITITELNGCGSLTLEVSVVDYMKYFTPNGDGVNDTWRIIGLESQTNAQVFIFDRQGKLVKQLSSTSDGWNGTFNGTMLPSNDYWFKAVYTEPNTGQVKEFTS